MGRIHAGLLLATACTRATHAPADAASSDAIRPAQGPYATHILAPTAEPPEVSLETDRDVVLQGQLPSVGVSEGDRGVGHYRETSDFTLEQPDGSPAAHECDAARQPASSRGFASLNFECHPLEEPGVYTVGLDPERLGLSGSLVTLRIRVLAEAPPLRAAPGKWQAIPLAARVPPYACYGYGESYAVSSTGKAPVIVREERPKAARIPVDLAARLTADHASVVRYVFEMNDGWIVLFDHGEFGGGAEWFARAGGAPRSIGVGPRDEENPPPQNVNRALAVGGDLYLLQGLSHMGMSEGQLARLWREHDHFTSHVIAHFASEPVDWSRERDGSWVVATWTAIWRVWENGRMQRLVRLPEVLWYPNSLARTDDGTFYVGTRGGVLRLSPTWTDEPRYAADFLIPPEREPDCRPDAHEPD